MSLTFNIKSYLLTSVALLLIYFSGNSQVYTQWDFLYPLNIKAVVSGSFGELRGGHFHSGIDFATNQQTGYPIFSIDDGYVSRVVVSPVGYGKAIYVNHPNGYTSVYAHCEWFSGKIEEIITDIQYKNESFAIDQTFTTNQIQIKRGETIAYTGNSGSSGGPHLHFEIRETTNQRPINVHKLNLPVKDDVPPHIEAICIYPLDENSLINGKNEPLYLPVVAHSGRFHLRGNPQIAASGTIGVGIETLDYFTGSWRKCGVYSIELIVDGQSWFKSQLDSWLFSQTRYLNSHIDFARRRNHKQVIQKSFIDKNNLLDIYTSTHEKGRVKMIHGQSHEFSYKISDAAGNTSQLMFNVRGIASAPQAFTLNDATLQNTINPQQAYSKEIEGFKVNFPENSFYTPITPSFDVKDNAGLGIGKHISVLNENIPIHNFFEISIPIPDDISHKGLTGARVNGARLVYASGRIVNNNYIIRTRDAGTYCLTTDIIPPTIRIQNVPQNRNYSNREAIRIEIRDDFSGIETYQCTINEQWALFEYDAKNNVLIGFFKNLRIPKGSKHKLEVTITDRAGNVATHKTDFIY